MIKYYLYFLLFIPLMSAAQVIGIQDLKDTSDAQDEQFLEEKIALGKNVDIPLFINVTSKGNGTLEIPGIQIKVYDDHDDGFYYENFMLRMEFFDLDNNGLKELIISGIVCETDETSVKQIVKKRDALVRIYQYDMGTKKFVEIYRNDTEIP